MWRSPAFWRLLVYFPLLLLGAEAFIHLLQVIAGRIAYPYELEWMEGGMLHQVLRVLHGQPLYGDPSMDFVPALYMPLYYYFSALSALVLGEGLFALRVVSAMAALATHALVFLIVRKVSRSRLAAIVGFLLFAWTYPLSTFWFDVARVDSLWTFFLAAMLYALLFVRDAPCMRNIVVMVIVSVAAFFTKQATLFLLPFFTLAMLCWAGWRAAFLFCCLFSVAVVSFALWLQIYEGGRFFFYTMGMASTHGVTPAGFMRFFLDILSSVVLMLLSALCYPWLARGGWGEKLGWFCILCGFVFLSMLSRAYAGAFFNVLMPLHFCIAVFVPLLLASLLERAQMTQPSPARWAWVPLVLLVVAAATEMHRYRYNPDSQLPVATSTDAYKTLLQQIAAVDGNVCVTSHGYLAWQAGKPFCAHNTQVTDVMTGSNPVLAQMLRDDARQKILGGYYAVIVLDREKELEDLGLQWPDIPYTVTPIQYGGGSITFPVNGYSPKLWLTFNGSGFDKEIQDAR